MEAHHLHEVTATPTYGFGKYKGVVYAVEWTLRVQSVYAWGVDGPPPFDTPPEEVWPAQFGDVKIGQRTLQRSTPLHVYTWHAEPSGELRTLVWWELAVHGFSVN